MPVAILGVNVCAGLDEELDDLGAIIGCCGDQGRSLLETMDIDFGFAGQQELNDFNVAGIGRDEERGAVESGADLGLGAALEKFPNDPGVPLLGGDVQCSGFGYTDRVS